MPIPDPRLDARKVGQRAAMLAALAKLCDADGELRCHPLDIVGQTGIPGHDVVKRLWAFQKEGYLVLGTGQTRSHSKSQAIKRVRLTPRGRAHVALIARG